MMLESTCGAHVAMLVLARHGHSLQAVMSAVHLWYLQKQRLAARLMLLPQGPSLHPSPAVKDCCIIYLHAEALVARLLLAFEDCFFHSMPRFKSMCSMGLQRRRQRG